MERDDRARLRAGDPGAFGRLYDEYARSVYNHAFRLTGNWSTAEDVTALTYLEAWRLRARIDPDGGSLRPWLLGIATNAARNTTRTARRYEAATARLPRDDVLPDFADELVCRIDDAERLAAVQAALGRLRRAEREVFALCVWSGLDYAEAARALGVPIGTVRSRLARARKKLRKLADGQISGENGELRGGRGQIPGSRAHRATRPTQEGAR
ncbi:RNA polymerase sigma factor [Actinacidiphila epipremni]|jgi:RNA polymerase sigma-70 factor (ECF subfamily)|uniref:RNA polymerase sigma factor n=1 Tax=Actinacidiphila epipremni TaxID=2053013 RepID=A0ABX0ZJZ9_9ACTN|nr:RNA polymerase sigma factor [Actinacidiphila epipremni]NJP43365.1 RNA polymerase sigma factor [Actinacidiphila epipremni]